MSFALNRFQTKSLLYFVRMSSKPNTRSKSKLTSDVVKTSKYFETNLLNESKRESTEVSKVSKRRKNKTEIDGQSDETTNEPKNWLKMFENIKKMRSKRDAVVDHMGAEKTFDANEGNLKDKRFQVLISLMLSSQTRDELTYKTMQSLKDYGLTVDHVIQTSEDHLKQLIRSVSFYNTKAKHIKRTADILRDQYDDDIPDTVKGLMDLPGVGPKMAHLAMKIAWNQCTGIAVDTHVHRICNRLLWTDSKAPEQTQRQLEKWLPKDLWDEFNLLFVGFGQTICSAISPKCGQCLNRNICPFNLKNKSNLDF